MRTPPSEIILSYGLRRGGDSMTNATWREKSMKQKSFILKRVELETPLLFAQFLLNGRAAGRNTSGGAIRKKRQKPAAFMFLAKPVGAC